MSRRENQCAGRLRSGQTLAAIDDRQPLIGLLEYRGNC
jgi:hypothetical protein